MRATTTCLLAITALAWAEDSNPDYTFGTTVVNNAGFHGRVYHLKENTQRLPNFKSMRPVGSIYTTALNIWPQRFDQGFGEITDRFEWFAIEYTATIWIEKEGAYRFSLLADDGARLKIDDKLVIDNDLVHWARAISGAATLGRGSHTITVEYFQGPRFTVALVLAVAPPEQAWRILNTDEFKPPKDPSEWKPGAIQVTRPQSL